MDGLFSLILKKPSDGADTDVLSKMLKNKWHMIKGINVQKGQINEFDINRPDFKESIFMIIQNKLLFEKTYSL